MSFDIVPDVPQSIPTEIAVIAAVVVGGLESGSLNIKSFNDGRHRKIYRAIESLLAEGKIPDHLTIAHHLNIDLIPYLGVVCTNQDWTPHSHSQNVQRLLELSQRREWLTLASKLQKEAITPSMPMDQFSGKVIDELIHAPINEEDQTTAKMMPVVRTGYEATEKLSAQGKRFAGLDAGFDAINNALNGLLSGELTVLAARNAVGKTTLALQTAISVSDHSPVGIFSLEMTPQQIGGRLACLISGIDPWHQRRGLLAGDARERFYKATYEVQDLPITCYDGSSVAQMRSQIKRHPEVKLWIIDHLHRMKGPGKEKYQMYAEISEGLANLSLQYEVPLLLLAQLNRQCEARPDKRPEMADLRDCGSIEECAVNLGLIYRPGRYPDLVEKFEKSLKKEGLTKDQTEAAVYEYTCKAQLLWEKCRFEGTSNQELGWVPEKGYFINKEK